METKEELWAWPKVVDVEQAIKRFIAKAHPEKEGSLKSEFYFKSIKEIFFFLL